MKRNVNHLTTAFNNGEEMKNYLKLFFAMFADINGLRFV